LVDGWADACRCIDGRRKLSTETGQNKTNCDFTPCTFTPMILFSQWVVRIGRLLRAMRVCNQVTAAWGLHTANAHNRQVGPCVSWLGFKFKLPTGIVVVAPGKITCAVYFLDNIFSGTTATWNEYRSFIGLLENILLVVGGGSTFMYHRHGRNLHAGIIPAIRGGPLTQMIFKPRQIRALCRWSLTSITRAGSYFLLAPTLTQW
jgi:hypothetical protein